MSESIDVDDAIVALLRLAVVEREERIDPSLTERKVEVILAEAGLGHAQIAALTGKSAGAVRKIIARAK